MIKQPVIETDNKHQRIWLKLENGPRGEVNHFIDALLIAGQSNHDQAAISFCVGLKANERFYNNKLMTYFSTDQLNDFVHALSSYVSISDPYDGEDDDGTNDKLYRGNLNATVIDAEMSDVDSAGDDETGADEQDFDDGDTSVDNDDTQVDNM